MIGRYCLAMDMRGAMFRTCFTDVLDFEPADDLARGTTTIVRPTEGIESVKAFLPGNAVARRLIAL